MSDLLYKKTIKLNKELYGKWDRSTPKKVRLFLSDSLTSLDEKSDLKIYEKIIAKFIPQFLKDDLDIDFTDKEFEIIKKIYEEIEHA